MGLIGGLFKGAGVVVGKTAEVSVKTLGGAIGVVATMADKPDVAKKSFSISKNVGEFVGTSTQALANGAGYTLEKITEVGSSVGGNIAGYIAEVSGAEDSTVNKAKTIGKIAGGAAVGLVTGEVVGSAITGLTAATGAASTGTAISSLSGAAASNATLASIGGGALSTGGGGMAAGHAILNGINLGSTILGGATGRKTNSSKK